MSPEPKYYIPFNTNRKREFELYVVIVAICKIFLSLGKVTYEGSDIKGKEGVRTMVVEQMLEVGGFSGSGARLVVVGMMMEEVGKFLSPPPFYSCFW